jgi:hypothetical protein
MDRAETPHYRCIREGSRITALYNCGFNNSAYSHDYDVVTFLSGVCRRKGTPSAVRFIISHGGTIGGRTGSRRIKSLRWTGDSR